MPKYKVVAERTLVEAWTYTVTADSEREAIEKIEECPDGMCSGVKHNDDVNVYEDYTEYTLVEEIVKQKPKKNVRKKSR